MKIAIITLPQYTNYGGILQAYALQTVLKRMGHEVTVISRERYVRISFRLLFLSIPKRLVQRIILRKSVPVFPEFRWNKTIRTINSNIRPFVKKHIHQDHRLVDDLKEKDYDAYVVGSDQIWRPKYMKAFSKRQTAAYLDFTFGWNVKRIAYAASFGTDQWEYSEEETKEIRKYIPLFDSVSVREDSAVVLCRKYLGIESQHLLDPTMLLNSEDYVSLVEHPQSTGGDLFVYVLDRNSEIDGLAEKIAFDKSLHPFYGGSRVDDGSAPLEERVQPSIESWLNGFMHAKMVLTDSFHGCVFSILFNRPFLVIGNENRGLSRFSSLLHSFGLENHLIMNVSEYDSNNDYVISKETFDKLDSFRKRSFKYLNQTLND